MLAKVDELCGLVNTINGQVHHKAIMDLLTVHKNYGVYSNVARLTEIK